MSVADSDTSTEDRLSAVESALYALEDADYYLLKAGLTDAAHAAQRMFIEADEVRERLTEELNQSWKEQEQGTEQELRSFEYYCQALGLPFDPKEYT